MVGGDTCGVTERDLMDVGTIAYAIGIDEIMCIEISEDVMVHLGSLYMWSPEQVRKWKETSQKIWFIVNGLTI